MIQGAGTSEEMAIEERTQLATEGLVVAAVDIDRSSDNQQSRSDRSKKDSDDDIDDEDLSLTRMKGTVRLTTRAMFQGQGQLQSSLHKVYLCPK